MTEEKPTEAPPSGMSGVISQVNDVLKSKGINLEELAKNGEVALKPYMDKAKGYYSQASDMASPYVAQLQEKVNQFKETAMNALDTDGDGKISYNEMLAGLGKSPGWIMAGLGKLKNWLCGVGGDASKKATSEMSKVLEGVDKMMQEKLGIDLGKYLALNPNINTEPDSAPDAPAAPAAAKPAEPAEPAEPAAKPAEPAVTSS